jgi:hypothetical protein
MARRTLTSRIVRAVGRAAARELLGDTGLAHADAVLDATARWYGHRTRESVSGDDMAGFLTMLGDGNITKGRQRLATLTPAQLKAFKPRRMEW